MIVEQQAINRFFGQFEWESMKTSELLRNQDWTNVNSMNEELKIEDFLKALNVN